MPLLGWLMALWGRVRASPPVRWALIVIGALAVLLGWRALERRSAAREREERLRRQSAEQALARERERQDVEVDAARGSARERLRRDWSRPD